MAKFRYKHGDRPLDGFTIQRGAGRGGFGEVYYAVSDAGKEVALKTIQNYATIELRGISQCMNLKSPQLVTIFDVKYNADNEPFVIMEYVNGPSLNDLIQESNGGLGTQKAAFFLREIAKGLSYLHECGIVHRDLKPGNIFYENGQVKIGDYGLSKAINTTQHSGQTITVGTVHYMAPEIGEGKYDRGIDIYALGVVLYEMLTGNVPYFGASPAEVLMKHLSAEPDLSGIDETFARVIRRALSKDPKERYQTVQQMVEDVFGSEHVRNSVSQFRPESLSMIAEQVARKVKTANENANQYNNQQPQHENSFKKQEYNKPVQNGTANNDPVNIAQRETLSVIAAIAISLVGGFVHTVIPGYNMEHFPFVSLLLLICIYALSKTILFSRFKLFPNAGGNGTFGTRIALSIIAYMVWMLVFIGFNAMHIISLSLFLYKVSFLIMLAALFAIDWVKLSSPNRKARIALWPAILAGTCVLFVLSITNSGTAPEAFIIAGVILIVQIQSPFNIAGIGAAGVDKGQIPQPKPRPAYNQSKPVTGFSPTTVRNLKTSRYNRTIALLLTAGMCVGINGLQRFYVGKIGTGILWLLTGGLFGIGQIVDIIMIIVGSFKDQYGKYVENWEEEKIKREVKYHYDKARGAAERHTPKADNNTNNTRNQPSSQPQVNLHNAPSSTQVVVQMPREHGGFFNWLFSFIAGIFICGMIATGVAYALHIPEIIAKEYPGSEVARAMMEFFNTNEWGGIVNKMLVTAMYIFIFLAIVFKVLSRQGTSGKYISRGFMGVLGIAFSLRIFASHIQFDYSMLETNNFWLIIDRILSNSNVGIFPEGALFIASILILSWPYKRKKPKYITINNGNEGKL